MTINVYLAHGSYSVGISIAPPAMGEMSKSKEREAMIERKGRKNKGTSVDGKGSKRLPGDRDLSALSCFSQFCPHNFL